MVALEVPQKKWVESAVKEMDVTAPITLACFLTSIACDPTLARVPSPAPKRRSPFERRLMQLMPWEKSFLLGPILLKRLLVKEISTISPVLVPK